MPSSETVRRQRTLGGLIGVVVLGCALVYHFFPRVFHVNPATLTPRRDVAFQLPGRAAPAPAGRGRTVEESELNAGPPLSLAPAAVMAARLDRRRERPPEQASEESPEIQALVRRAGKALQDNHLVGDADSAAALYLQALKTQPDSHAATYGLAQVRSRLAAQIGQDIAVGDEESARQLLGALAALPDSGDAVAQLQQSLATLDRVRPMLGRAAALLQQGHADQPPGASALDLYRQVQALDPQNAVAEQGIFQVQRVVLDRALAAVAQNDFKAADAALAAAAAIRADSRQFEDVRNRVQDMRAHRAKGLLDQARSALDGGNLVLAQQLAAQAQAIEPRLEGLDDFRQRLTNARLYASYKPGQVFSDRYVDLPGHAPEMVVIPTGSFMMGSPDDEADRQDAETPRHRVTLARGFAMARTEVTVAQFREFVRASSYRPDSVRLQGASIYDERTGVMRQDPSATWEDDYAGRPAKDDLPVVNVSWGDARAYATWLSQRTGKTYRLPSEAEFEYAQRGGTQTRYWWGGGTPVGKVENLTGSGDRSRRSRRWSNAFADYHDGYWGPAPVASFKPNPFGLYDIDGNVSEWVADCWHDNYVRAPVDGGPWLNPGCSTHVLRGGSWGSAPPQVRSAYRQGADGSVRSGRVGFRVVRDLSTAP